MKIKELFSAEVFSDLHASKEIKSISSDTREKNVDGVFFCIKGMNFDSHEFVLDAISNGASCVVYDKDLPIDTADYPNVAFVRVGDSRLELARLAELFYNRPSSQLDVYGVTGTNGKTTTSYIIYQILSKIEKSAYNGTAGTLICGKESPYAHLTTPDTLKLVSVLNDAVKAGAKSIALEVSSHALDMKRAHGIDFDVAISTNLTRDHLDYHGDMDSYLKAKCTLFELLNPEGVAIINEDEDHAAHFKAAAQTKRIFTYGCSQSANYRFSDLKLNSGGTDFTLHCFGEMHRVKTSLISKINVYNLCAAIAAIHQMGHSMDSIVAAVEDIPFAIGRFQFVPSPDYSIIVDYAHTPDGFEKIFEFTDAIKTKATRVLSVFGSAGKRDKGKRPIMGKIAAEHSDLLILCEEDCRDEKPSDIARDIAAGAEGICEYIIEDNREVAIRLAFENANKGDIIVILGKGVEDFIDRDDRSDPWLGDHVLAEKYSKL